jgi:hypothetical protein
LGLKTPSAYFPLPRPVGCVNAQLVAGHQAHVLTSSTAGHSKQGTQYSTELPGKHVPQTLGDISASVPAEDKKQYINALLPTNVSAGQPSHTLTHARDGKFVSEQQAHEIAFSAQLPVGVVSQHSEALDIQREVSNQGTGSKHVSPFGCLNTVFDVPRENKQAAGDGVIMASGHPADVSFPGEIKTKNSQISQSVSDPFHGNDTLMQDECIFKIPNHGDGASSFQKPTDMTELPCLQQGGIGNVMFLQDYDMPAEQYPYNAAYSSACPGQKSSLHSFPINSNVRTVQRDSSVPQYSNNDPRFSQIRDTGVIPQDALFLPYSANILEQVAHSVPVAGDSLPRSAHVMQQDHLAHQEMPDSESVEQELTGKLEQLTGINIY